MYYRFIYKNEENSVYGRLTIIGEGPKDKYGDPTVLTRCECGKETVKKFRNLLTGNTKRCGMGCEARSKYDHLCFVSKKDVAIYKITSPEGCVYIGQSRNLKNRWRQYLSKKRSAATSKIEKSIELHGGNNHTYEILHKLPVDVSNEVMDVYEDLYLSFYESAGFTCLNEKRGGKNGLHSEFSKSKMRGVNGIWMKGRKLPRHVIEKAINTKKKNGYKISEESRERYRKSKIGSLNHKSKLTSEQVLEIVSERKKGVKLIELANKYNVVISCISGIVLGYQWSEITGIPKKQKRKNK